MRRLQMNRFATSNRLMLVLRSQWDVDHQHDRP